jgi:hypothetical protein
MGSTPGAFAGDSNGRELVTTEGTGQVHDRSGSHSSSRLGGGRRLHGVRCPIGSARVSNLSMQGNVDGQGLTSDHADQEDEDARGSTSLDLHDDSNLSVVRAQGSRDALTIHCFLRSTLLVDRSCVGLQPSSSSIVNDATPSGCVKGACSKSSSASNLS